MEPLRSVKIRSKLSLVVCLIDTYTAEPPLGRNTSVVLEGVMQKPIVKSEGYYIFTGLPEGSYKAIVKSSDYIEVSLEITLNSINPIVYIPLSPRPSFSFSSNATLIRAALQDSSGKPVVDAYVKAVVQSEDCVRARLAQDVANIGETEVILASFSGKVSIEDIFLIIEKRSEESEFCSISNIIEGMRCFELKNPLRFNHYRGAMFLPVVETRSDEKGEVVVPFRNYRSKQFNVKLEINCKDHILFKEVSVKEGTMTYLGAIHM